jgi:hypothetical protein
MSAIAFAIAVIIYFVAARLGWSPAPNDPRMLIADVLFVLSVWIFGFSVGMGVSAP